MQLKRSSWLAALYLASFTAAVEPGADSPDSSDTESTQSEGSDASSGYNKVEFYPAIMPFTGTPVSKEGPSPSFTFQHDFVAGELSYAPGKGRCMSEGLNCKGLSLSLHWNPGAAFSARFDPLGPPAALAVADLGYVALGGFATVQEVREFLDASRVQLTIDIPVPALEDAYGGYYVHFHFEDVTGDELLVAATPDGSYEVYDTNWGEGEPLALPYTGEALSGADYPRGCRDPYSHGGWRGHSRYGERGHLGHRPSLGRTTSLGRTISMDSRTSSLGRTISMDSQYSSLGRTISMDSQYSSQSPPLGRTISIDERFAY